MSKKHIDIEQKIRSRLERQENRIFRNKAVLRPDYKIKELPHREKEEDTLIDNMLPILENQKPDNVFIYGKSGIGKTSVVRLVGGSLENIAGEQKLDFRFVYINCKVYSTFFKVMLKLQKDITGKPTGRSTSKMYERILAKIEDGLNAIIVLDEIDRVREDLDELLYILTRINEESGSGKISLIGITNTTSFKNKLDPRVKSTLWENEYIFKPYNADQLADILKDRIKMGLREDVIDMGDVNLIAAYAAQINGDARYALRLLFKSAYIAENDGQDRIVGDHIKEARVEVEKDIIKELLLSLPEHQQIVLYSIALAMEDTTIGIYTSIERGRKVLFSGECYEYYEKVSCKIDRRPRTTRWFREYLNDLEMMGLITMAVSGKGIRGNTQLIRLGHDSEEIIGVIGGGLGLKVALPVRGSREG